MKTIQLTLIQTEANDLLQALEVAMDAIHGDIDSTDQLRDFSILWDKVFDTGIAAGFANEYMEFADGERPEYMERGENDED